MAKMTLSKSTFTIIPEGTHTFKVVGVNDENYEDFGKLEVKLQTAKGETHIERFSLMRNDGEINEGALKAWSYFARTCLNNFQVDEIDTQDIVGCFITATVKHETSQGKGENAGKTYVNVRLNDYTTASSFGSAATVDDEDDLDDLEELDDLD